jgi:sigma-B regulation protein RsbU (phosphoserine phosphatase)
MMSQTLGQANWTNRWSPVAIVATILVGAIAGSQGGEFFINRVLRPDLEEWSWISEILMTFALLVTTTLWTRLRLAQTAVVTLERERVRSQAELAVAATVQRALLPVIPAPAHGITWFAAMEPAGLVGGDYYDFFADADGRMWLLVADVSGKGVPAAVFVSNARAVVRAVARERVTPGELLASVSDILLADGRGDVYVTCFAAVVDTARRTMTYSNAGHPPGLVIRRRHRGHRNDGCGVRALSAGGPPLGLVPGARYQDETVELLGGDLAIVVSDGITDALNASGDDIPGLVAAAVARAETPREACKALLAAAGRGPGPEGSVGWADDRTVLAFRVSARPERGPHHA